MRMNETFLVKGNCDLCVKRPAVNQIDNSFLEKRIKLCAVCVKLIAYSEVENARKEVLNSAEFKSLLSQAQANGAKNELIFMLKIAKKEPRDDWAIVYIKKRLAELK